jgi:acyl carrier protein
MTKKNFFNQVEELLELEGELETNDETLIEDILEIDSLGHITLISLIKDSFGIEIKAEDFSQFVTLKDIVSKIGEANFAS